MKISLITVCYNAERTIEKTLKSVLSQTYSNFEYLIIDAESDDNTLKIVDKYKKEFGNRIKVVSEKDEGIYDGMNKGVRLSTGNVIGILNADDIFANNYVFEKIADAFDRESCDGVYADLVYMDHDSMSIPYREFISGNYSKRGTWHPTHPTLYLKREVYQKVGEYNLNYRIAADLDFMLRVKKIGAKLIYIKEYFVIMRAGGVSTNGLKGYYNNFKESYVAIKNNGIKVPFIVNCFRIIKTFNQGLRAKYRKNKIINRLRLENKSS